MGEAPHLPKKHERTMYKMCCQIRKLFIAHFQFNCFLSSHTHTCEGYGTKGKFIKFYLRVERRQEKSFCSSQISLLKIYNSFSIF